jgi:hypothetical protein
MELVKTLTTQLEINLAFGSVRFWGLLLSTVAIRLLAYLVLPLIGIAFKWVVVGKYRAGVYPVHGGYGSRHSLPSAVTFGV